jgi:hypothetical protein
LQLLLQFLDLTRQVAILKPTQKHIRKVCYCVANLRVQLAAPDLIDRRTQQGHHLRHREQWQFRLHRRQNRHRLVLAPSASSPPGISCRRAAGIVKDAANLARQCSRSAWRAIQFFERAEGMHQSSVASVLAGNKQRAQLPKQLGLEVVPLVLMLRLVDSTMLA